MELYKNKDWLQKKYWDEGLNTYQIGRLCNCSWSAVHGWMLKFGIPRRNSVDAQLAKQHKRPYWDKKWLQQKYWKEQLSALKIAKICGASHSTVCDWMEKFYIPRRNKSDVMKLRWNSRKYVMDETVFEMCDTPEKAYWLGFIMADGGIDGIKSLIVGLQIKDTNHLEKLRSFFQTDAPVRVYPNIKSPRAILKISRQKVIKDLIQYHIIPNKTKQLKFPEIPKKYYPDFIRGYFDGDGCICKNKCNQLRFMIYSGTKSFLKTIQKIIMANCHVSQTRIIHTGQKQYEAHALCYNGNRQVRRIMDYLCSNSAIRLERKYAWIGGEN